MKWIGQPCTGGSSISNLKLYGKLCQSKAHLCSLSLKGQRSQRRVQIRESPCKGQPKCFLAKQTWSLSQSLRCLASSAASPGTSDPPSAWILRLAKFATEQFLPLALLTGITIGSFFPSGGVHAANVGLQSITTTGIFIISGLSLRRGETVQAFSSWGSVAFGMLSILVFTPLSAFVALRLPLQPPELAFGLAVFCCMPTTLSSGVSLTQAVGGNTALALLLTVGSNLLGIFTMPFVLSAILGAVKGSIQIAPGPLLQSLIKTILVPLLIGASARAFVPGLSGMIDRRKKVLAMFSAVLLAMVPWMQISKAVADHVAVQPAALLAAVSAGVAIHLVFLAFNMAAVSALQLGGSEKPSGVHFRRGLVLVCSQKTLSVAALLLPQIAAEPGMQLDASQAGLAMVVCVFVYIVQLAIDFGIGSQWAKSSTNEP